MGCGKTGRFLSSDHLTPSFESLNSAALTLPRPDLLTLGKSISGGIYPATYVLGRQECMNLIGVKEIFSTYGFSPVAVAATTAAIRVIDEENLVEKAQMIERVFREVTNSWLVKTDGDIEDSYVSLAARKCIKYVSAVGAELGIWLREDLRGGQETVRAIGAICLRDGLLVFPNHRRIRMSVALVITEEEFRNGLEILRQALDEVLQSVQA